MLKKIPIAAVSVGMYIHAFDGKWVDHPFWRGRFSLTNDEDLQRIRRSGIENLWVDITKGLDVIATDTSACVTAEEQPMATAADIIITRPGIEEEVSRAVEICSRAKAAVVSMFNDARMGNVISADNAAELISEISESVLRHPHALISLSRLKTSDEYTYMHSVAVCALMMALARTLKMTEAQVREAGIAGLMHDVGKILIPESILNKAGKLTPEEYQIMQGHSMAGARILEASQRVSAMVLDVCLHHHEKMDGSGYPHGLHAQDISVFARMAAVCDVYDAVTSERPYKKGWEPAHSVREMASWAGHFDPCIFQAFVKTVGIYPVGALVSLESGRLGVVVEQNEQSLLLPKVKVFLSTRTKKAIRNDVVDLVKLSGRDKILQIELAATWNVTNVDELWSGLPAGNSGMFT